MVTSIIAKMITDYNFQIDYLNVGEFWIFKVVTLVSILCANFNTVS